MYYYLMFSSVLNFFGKKKEEPSSDNYNSETKKIEEFIKTTEEAKVEVVKPEASAYHLSLKEFGPRQLVVDSSEERKEFMNWDDELRLSEFLKRLKDWWYSIIIYKLFKVNR
jgi:hypothetical protein